jgi:hypothetical protein
MLAASQLNFNRGRELDGLTAMIHHLTNQHLSLLPHSSGVQASNFELSCHRDMQSPKVGEHLVQGLNDSKTQTCYTASKLHWAYRTCKELQDTQIPETMQQGCSTHTTQQSGCSQLKLFGQGRWTIYAHGIIPYMRMVSYHSWQLVHLHKAGKVGSLVSHMAATEHSIPVHLGGRDRHQQ